MNEMKTQYAQIYWVLLKQCLKGKYWSGVPTFKKRSQINNLTSHPKKLEKEHSKPQARIRKTVIKIR